MQVMLGFGTGSPGHAFQSLLGTTTMSCLHLSIRKRILSWDIGALKKKTVSPADAILRLSQMNTDLFGGVDAIMKYVLEGHDLGLHFILACLSLCLEQMTDK